VVLGGVAASAQTVARQAVAKSSMRSAPVQPAPTAPNRMTGSCQPNWSTSFGGSSGANSSVFGLAVFDDGSGPALYAGGAFSSVDGVPANSIARWNGTSWSALLNGMGGGSVTALAVFDDGNGSALYAGGTFVSAGSVAANRIAKWDGTSWSALGSGVSGGYVSALIAFDDGNGSALYACGSFTSAGGVAAERIARWNGTSWSALAGGWGSGSPAFISSLAVYDAGSGPALHAGGTMQNMGGPPSSFVARWDGGNWSLLTNPWDAGESVLALAVGNLGSGSALYAGGDFVSVGGVWANGIAQWNGSAWSPLGSGMNYVWEPPVQALTILDDGTGPALYAGGTFSTAGGAAASNIARWDGTQWAALGSGVNAAVFALAPYDHGNGPALFAGGSFTSAGGAPSNHIAEWAMPPGCAQPGLAVCEPGANGTLACPCANPPAGLGRGCDNSAATGGARLEASGTASLVHDSLVFATSGEMPDALSILLQGTALNPGGISFAQGVRCNTGLMRRLYFQLALGGSVTLPGPGEPSVSARSAAFGDVIAPGTHRYYGVYYRDPNVLGGCSALSTYNITQQLDVLWHP
jgi:hypothetical protein